MLGLFTSLITSSKIFCFMGDIRLWVHDIDDCWAAFKKPSPPNTQAMNDYLDDLLGLRQFLDEVVRPQGAVSGACTNRSLHLTKDLSARVGLQGPVIVEGGLQMWGPMTGVVTALAAKIRPEHKELYQRFEEWIFEEAPGIHHHIVKKFGDDVILMDNFSMYTLEFNSREDPETIFRYLAVEGYLPEEFYQGMQKGLFTLSTVDFAFDFKPSISKGDGVRYALDKIGVSRGEVLGTGNSSHSDKAMMDACAFVGCPANADDQLQAYVRERGGFVSSKPYMEGILEVGEHFFGSG